MFTVQQPSARLLLIQHCMTPIVPELHSGDADRAVEPTLLIPLPGPYESLDDVEVLSAADASPIDVGCSVRGTWMPTETAAA